MIVPRIIPAMLLRGAGLVKTVRFEKPVYLGDPVNVIRIFNDKEVDEVALLDIDASREGRAPNTRLIAEVASECFMPLSYGGGISSIGQIEGLLTLGVEKVVLNSAAASNPTLVAEAARRFGSSTVVVSVDVNRSLFGRRHVVARGGRDIVGTDPVGWAKRMEDLGAGEILLTAVYREGTLSGYDLGLVQEVSSALRIPVVALGGARNLQDLRAVVIEGGASAAAAGSMFVFHGPHRGVLISFPHRSDIEAAFAVDSSAR